MYEIVNVQYTGTYNNGGTRIPAVLGEFRASSAADLPAQNVDCHIICGCDGLDIATGDRYIWNGTAWILQPSDRAFSNVYTKPEIDSMTTEIYGVIAYYHTVIVSDTGEITFYSLGGNVGTWTIYGNGQQTGTPTPGNPVMPKFVGVRTGNLWNEDYTNISATIQYIPIYVGDGNFTLSTTTPYDRQVANLFLLCGNVSSGASTQGNGAWRKNNVTTQSDGGYVTIAYRHFSGTTSPADCKTMLNAGTAPIPYEPYGYKIPITCGGQTNNIYLSAPLRKAIDGTDAVDRLDSTGTITRNVDENGDALVAPTTETIDVPEIPTGKGSNTLTVDTELQPSLIEISGGITHE